MVTMYREFERTLPDVRPSFKLLYCMLTFQRNILLNTKLMNKKGFRITVLGPIITSIHLKFS